MIVHTAVPKEMNERRQPAMLPDRRNACSLVPCRLGRRARIANKETTMSLLTLKVMAGLLQLQGTGAQIQSDHQGLNALLDNMQGDPRTAAPAQAQEEDKVLADKPQVEQVYFRKGFVRAPYAGAFRRGYVPGAFRRAFGRSY
jgi:hypothetical protein